MVSTSTLFVCEYEEGASLVKASDVRVLLAANSVGGQENRLSSDRGELLEAMSFLYSVVQLPGTKTNLDLTGCGDALNDQQLWVIRNLERLVIVRYNDVSLARTVTERIDDLALTDTEGWRQVRSEERAK